MTGRVTGRVTGRIARIVSRTVALRPVRPGDAAFLYALRTDGALGRHLSPTAGGVGEQAAWIEAYLERERAGTEAYFLIAALDGGAPVGCVRLYGIADGAFTWGSWILSPAKPKSAAIESALAVYEAGFGVYGCDRAVFDVRRENRHTIAFHERFGAVRTGEDTADVHFVVERTRYRADLRPALAQFPVEIVMADDI